jgi:exopolysaccharide biosynthesis polyprenyl glycosylphosphotransferase
MSYRLFSRMTGDRSLNKLISTLFIDMLGLILLIAAFPLSIWAMKKFFLSDMEIKTGEILFFFLFILISWFALSRITGQANIPRTQRNLNHIFRYARLTFIVLLGLVSVKMLFRLTSIPVLLILIYVAALFTVALIFKLLFFKAMKEIHAKGLDSHRVLLIADAFSDGIIESLMVHKEWGYRIQSIITDSRLIKAKYGSQFQIHPDGVNFKQMIDFGIIDEVIYTKRDVKINLIRDVSNLCNEVGVIFRLQSAVSPLDLTRFQLKTFNNRRDLSLVDTPSSSLSQVLKIMIDIYFSILALIFLIPIFVLIATIIKIGSKGPVFFKQERIGRRGRKFNIYKFRTMVNYAEEQLNILKDMNEANGPVFKIKYDPRITKSGRFLRNTGLDELPQLYNVIRGEMSLIGPRPPLEEEVSLYERWQLRRLSVKPGLTCSWQIIPSRHDVTFEKWMELDLQYIDNWNLSKDLVLFVKTIGTFFRAGGH